MTLVEVNSSSRLQRIRAWLDSLPGVSYVQESVRTMEDFPDDPGPIDPTPELPPETVTAVQEASGTLLQLFVRGLPPGRHGLHLHATPACEPPTFQTAAGHLNPAGAKHGRQNPEGPHLGDLPHLEVNRAGEARFEIRLDSVNLTPGLRSIGVPGTALVIHAGEDDERTDPTGNAGARIACAVLAISEQ